MSSINFLPWRRQRQRRRQYYFITVLFITLAANTSCFAIIFNHSHMKYQSIREQKAMLDKNNQNEILSRQQYKHALQEKKQLTHYLLSHRHQQQAQQTLLNVLNTLQHKLRLSIQQIDYEKHSLTIKALLSEGNTLASIKKALSQSDDVVSMSVVNLSKQHNATMITIEFVLGNT
ncbi:MAG: hypothetical protein AAGA27_07095 [Pseudomonadota bacterium]